MIKYILCILFSTLVIFIMMQYGFKKIEKVSKIQKGLLILFLIGYILLTIINTTAFINQSLHFKSDKLDVVMNIVDFIERLFPFVGLIILCFDCSNNAKAIKNHPVIVASYLSLYTLIISLNLSFLLLNL